MPSVTKEKQKQVIQEGFFRFSFRTKKAGGAAVGPTRTQILRHLNLEDYSQASGFPPCCDRSLGGV